MRFAVFVATLFLSLASPVWAQQISVRSGEHPGFSRLVFMFPAGTGWSLDPVAGGYRMTTTAKQFRYDLADIFRFIPKTRIVAVEPAVDAQSVFIETPQDVHSDVFQLPNGALVLDIVDGAVTTEPAAPVSAAPSFRPQAKVAYLDLFWRTQDDKGAKTPYSRGDAPAPAPLPLAKLDLPDPRVEAAESELIDQLGRAASQGLITLELPERPMTAPPTPDPPPQPPETSASGQHLALSSQTVIDRDSASAWGGAGLAANGHNCPPDEAFDLQSWLGDKPAAELIADTRRDLVGEFDKPRPESVAALARLYVALGFGAEARALHRAFQLDDGLDPNLLLLAGILDNRPIAPEIDMKGLSACDGKVALWAVLALNGAARKDEVNFGALLRSYSSLPSEIREIVGPRLSSLLIDMGAADVAKTVRSMLARVPVEPQTSLHLIDAQIGLTEGRQDEAAMLLDQVAKGNSDQAAAALVLAIETRLSHGEAIAQDDVENAGALALQLKETSTGYKLKRAEILGLGSTAQFAAAFDSLDDWPVETRDDLFQQTRNDLFAMLGRVPDETVFIRAYYQHSAEAVAAPLAPETEVALADRLAKNGFWQAAREVLSSSTRRSAAGRLSLARAALTGRDAAAALAHLSDLAGDDAAALRGSALSMLGKHDTAESEYAQAGDNAALLDEAWRSGNWDLVAQQGSAPQREFLARFGVVADGAAAAPPEPIPGALAEAEWLIRQSESEREAYSGLMKALETE